MLRRQRPTIFALTHVHHRNFSENAVIQSISHGLAFLKLESTGWLHVPLDDCDFCIDEYDLRPNPKGHLTAQDQALIFDIQRCHRCRHNRLDCTCPIPLIHPLAAPGHWLAYDNATGQMIRRPFERLTLENPHDPARNQT